MMKKALLAGLMACAAAPALAQTPPPPNPYAPLPDHPSCTRDELKALTAAYVEGQKKGSLAGLPLDAKVHYLENMKDVTATTGMWARPLVVANANSFHDDKRCKTFTEVIVTAPVPYVIGTRLYVDKGKVLRVDSIYIKKGDWLFNANSYLTHTRTENWEPVFKYQKTAPGAMIAGANAYLDGFSDKFTDIPWGTPCARIEGGAYTNVKGDPNASCELGMPGGVLYITHRDYMVDEEKGVINVFCRFGGRAESPDSHTFRYIDGKFRQVHTLTPIPGSQAADDGSVPRADPNAPKTLKAGASLNERNPAGRLAGFLCTTLICALHGGLTIRGLLSCLIATVGGEAMSELADKLRPLIGGEPRSATQVRPVSRVSLTLTDKDAFEKSTRFAVDWLASKVGGALPEEASALASFDTRGTDGLHPCHATRLDDPTGSIWAARIDEPGSNPEAGETWITELFVERPVGGLVRFGAQLMARRPTGSPDLRPSRPRLVYDLLRTLSAEVDGEPIGDTPVPLTTHADADTLASLIYRPARRLPIVAVSTDQWGGAQIELNRLGIRLSGAAHLFSLHPDTSWELTRLLDKRMSTFNGGVRIYMPGVIEDEEDPFQHPLWLVPPARENPRLIGQLAERIFPLGFQDNDGETRFWHIAQLRKAASASAAQRIVGTEADKLRSQIVGMQDEITELREQLEIAEGLERIASNNEKAAQQDVQRIQDENSRFKAEIFRLRQGVANGGDVVEEKSEDRRLRSYDELDDWADEVLGPHIHIHSKALKDCRRNGHPEMMDRIANTLIAIRDYWIPSRLTGGLEKKEAAERALAALGVEDESCFARREKARERPDYSVRDGSITWVLYDHFKYGTSRQNSEQFRIYYAWDDEGHRLIVGKMPSHLSNDMS